MRTTEEFHRFVMDDILGHIKSVTSKPMFGGYGIYKEGIIFAIIAHGALYFKVDEINRSDFEESGSKPFVYRGKGRPVAMSYFELPAEIMEDKKRIREWVDKALIASKNVRRR